MAHSWLMTNTVCLNPPPVHGGRTLAPPHSSTYPLHIRLPPKTATLHLLNQPPLKSTSFSINNTTTPTSPPSRRSPPQLVVPSHLFNDDKGLHYPYRLLDLKDLNPNDQTEYYKSAGVESLRWRYPWDKESLFPDDARYIGSSHGWLAVVHPRTFQMFLFNPNDPEQIVPLPPLETLHPLIAGGCVSKSNLPSSPSPLTGNYLFGGIDGTYPSRRLCDQEFTGEIRYPHKIIMSSADPNNCVIMAVSFFALYFCKPGDAAWTELQNSKDLMFEEAIFSDSHKCFFVTDCLQEATWIQSWELSDLLDRDDHYQFDVRLDQQPKNSKREQLFPISNYTGRSYLVESCDSSFGEDENDILMVERYLSDCPMECHHRTITFDVYKLNLEKMVWEPVDCLGDEALFVGVNHSVSVLVGDRNGMIKPNCIYFTDDLSPKIHNYGYGGCDIGVFDLKENKIDRYHFGDPDIVKKIHPPPLWFLS